MPGTQITNKTHTHTSTQLSLLGHSKALFSVCRLALYWQTLIWDPNQDIRYAHVRTHRPAYGRKLGNKNKYTDVHQMHAGIRYVRTHPLLPIYGGVFFSAPSAGPWWQRQMEGPRGDWLANVSGEISLRFLASYKIRLTAAVGPWFWFLVCSHQSLFACTHSVVFYHTITQVLFSLKIIRSNITLWLQIIG